MNRVRIRMGNKVKEYSIAKPWGDTLGQVEEYVERLLMNYGSATRYRMEYLGEYSWDVFVDDRKIGHAKAWEEPKPEAFDDTHGFWPVVILSVFAYLALC